MTLDDYKKKRDFGRTPEPRPGSAGAAPGGRSFVVHRHEARNLHYDLRLEHRGVLCSWAVPKGFSFDPKDKRLAVRTEDHPMEYTHFEGIIPKGEYGAGTMKIWDRGTFELVVEPDMDRAVEIGEIKVVLRGRKLRGEWHIVKTKQAPNSWLLFKSKDRYAGKGRDSVLGISLDVAVRAAMPERVEFMRVERERAPFSDPGWLFEMKFAGRRVLAEKDGDATRLRGVDVEVPVVDVALGKLAAERALLDGVLVAADEKGRPDRDELERRLAAGDVGALQFYAFDLLYFDEFDLRPMTQLDRKAALRAVLPKAASLLFVDHVAGNGESLVDVVATAGLPAVIAKRADGRYGGEGEWVEVPVEGAVGGHAVAAVQDVDSALAQGKKSARGGRVKFSNLDKVYWPAEGYTKGDLLAYYDQVAEYLVPHMVDRPVHMLRYPDGIDGKFFYQRQAPEHLPEWFETVRIQSSRKEEDHHQMVCTGRDSLLTLVNLGSIDLHPWLSRRGSLDSPDFALIDLDPKGAPFENVVRIARVVGRILRGIGLTPYVKTSGKTGIHIYVPLLTGYTYEHSRMFCEGVARAVCREVPDIATVERGMGSREGKVYVDFLQNRRGQTIVPCYAVRPVPGAQVSTPLEWDELDRNLHPANFTIQTTLSRFAERGDLFRKTLTDRQDLLPAIEALQNYMR
jgi:bifunctional non-homologous end joining protein LigD